MLIVFGDITMHAKVPRAQVKKLLGDGPRRLVVDGTLTARDREYLDAMGRTGARGVMLSFVERPSDAEEVRGLLPDVDLVLKIEDGRGLAFARDHGARPGRLCAGRGDLCVEVGRPHRIVGALRTIVAAELSEAVG